MMPWLWIAMLGLGTLLIRATFLVGSAGRTPPPVVARVLRLVPAAVLSALVVPALVYDDTHLYVSFANDHLVAGLFAALVAWKTRSVPWTLALGMIAMWALKAV
jgi:branched-subunit amino acid transport protein